MTNLTIAQKAVMASPLAMEIIINEAYEAIASKFNTSVDMVKSAIAQGNENCMKMLSELMVTGVNEAAKLV